ncbi:MAG TPA: RNA 2',3'-cyclic phosphodiesterase [Candidatus Limnocylindrales bacterium]|nr:RNA 2',3'-cyclic phosphodiesterase [Candidatus Limnocylindrales bacterium]
MTAAAENFRCFVAVRVGDNIAEGILQTLQELKTTAEQSRWRVSWTQPESWHATLKFLGDVASDRIEELLKALEPVFLEVPPFRVAAIGLMTLPPASQPRVVAVALRDEGSLARLAAGVENALEPLGFARESRRFTPHLTLGRVRSTPAVPRRVPKGSPRETPPMAYLLDRMREHDFGEDTIDRVELVRSRLSPGGSMYESLAAFELPKDRPDANGLQ